MELIEVKKEIEVQRRAYLDGLPQAIVSQADYVLVSQALLEIKDRMKAIDERLEPEKKIAYAAYKGWIKLIDELKAPYLERESLYKGEMARWSDEQEKIRREQERILQEQARIQEEEERLAAAVAAEQGGDQAAAEAILEDEVFVAPVVLPKSTPQVEGISYRTAWEFEVVDPKAVPEEYKMIDEVKIGKVVRASGGTVKIPGIRVFPKKVVAAGRR